MSPDVRKKSKIMSNATAMTSASEGIPSCKKSMVYVAAEPPGIGGVDTADMAVITTAITIQLTET